MSERHSDLSCDFELKAEGSDCATFTGVASTSALDLQNEIIQAGAFDPIDPRKVQMLRDHDRGSVIGGWTSFKQDGEKLLVEGELCLEVEKARETYALLRKGYLNGLSVGYKLNPSGILTDRKSGKRIVTKGELKECSIVAFPANEEARIIAVKSEGAVVEWLTERGFDPNDLEDLLRLYQESKQEIDYIDIEQDGTKRIAPAKPHGDVTYADPGYLDHNRDQASSSGLTPVKRYPVHQESNIRAAWSYINMPRNQTGYKPAQLAAIKGRIIAAWKRHIDSAGPPAYSGKEESRSALNITSIEDDGPVIKQETARIALGNIADLLAQLKGRGHARR